MTACICGGVIELVLGCGLATVAATAAIIVDWIRGI